MSEIGHCNKLAMKLPKSIDQARRTSESEAKGAPACWTMQTMHHSRWVIMSIMGHKNVSILHQKAPKDSTNTWKRGSLSWTLHFIFTSFINLLDTLLITLKL